MIKKKKPLKHTLFFPALLCWVSAFSVQCVKKKNILVFSFWWFSSVSDRLPPEASHLHFPVNEDTCKTQIQGSEEMATLVSFTCNPTDRNWKEVLISQQSYLVFKCFRHPPEDSPKCTFFLLFIFFPKIMQDSQFLEKIFFSCKT